MGHAYCDYLKDVLAPWAVVAARRMFGGWGLYRGDKMFGIVMEDMPYFKVGDSNRADYEAAGMEPFSYLAAKGGRRVALSYWQVPGEVLDDEGALMEWAEKAWRAALASGAQKKKRRPRKRARG